MHLLKIVANQLPEDVQHLTTQSRAATIVGDLAMQGLPGYDITLSTDWNGPLTTVSLCGWLFSWL
jgi:hypothetical protein